MSVTKEQEDWQTIQRQQAEIERLRKVIKAAYLRLGDGYTWSKPADVQLYLKEALEDE